MHGKSSTKFDFLVFPIQQKETKKISMLDSESPEVELRTWEE
jgi:hypothetical protein